MPDHLIEGLKRFRQETFPRFRDRYRQLVSEGQKPTTLFIGCADSRIVPDLLMGTGPGELFIVRNVGAFVPPFEPDGGFHGTSAGIEFATLALGVSSIVVCGHTHCGALRALYDEPNVATPNITKWLELGRPARVDGAAGAEPATEPATEPSPEVLRRTEQRSVAVQLERLMSYPMVVERVRAGTLTLHGWLYVIEEGQVLALDVESGRYVPLAE